MVCSPCDQLVIFAHGSGSSLKSVRNRSIAKALNQRGISTLLFDLLSENEAASIPNRFNIPKLTRRLVAATNWIMQQNATKGATVGYFGASTGAAAALAASLECNQVKTIVSRGGRPDLIMNELPRVNKPVLLIVGAKDTDVLAMNKKALENLNVNKKLIIVPGASHLFEEEGAMEQVTIIATDWFKQFLIKESRIPEHGKAI